MRAARFAVLLSSCALVASPLAAAPVRAEVLPTLVITSPVNGSFASGTISVTAAGTADATAGDAPDSMYLLVDGTLEQTSPCPGPSSSECSASFDLDVTPLTAGTHVVSVSMSTLGHSTVHVDVTIGIGSPAATVSAYLTQSAPVFAAYGAGYVGLSASATGWTHQAGLPMTLQMVADGVAVGVPQSCPPTVVGQSPCQTNLNARLAAGSHLVQARLSVGGATLDSAARAVSVLSPSVVITSPAAGTVVRGSVAVTVVGTAAGPGDAPKWLGVDLNGTTFVGQKAACPDPAAATCTATFTVPVTYLSSVRATFTTSHTTVSSASVPVVTYSTSTVGLGATSVAPGKVSRVDGGVGGLTNGARPSSVLLTLTPAIGKARVVTVLVTGSTFTYSFRPTVNTRVSADVAGTSAYSAAHAATTALVVPMPTCHLAARVARNTKTPLTCTLAHLPKNTRVTLQFSAHKRWYTAVSGRSAAGKVTVALHWSHVQTLWLRVVVDASKVYGRSVGKPFAIKVT